MSRPADRTLLNGVFKHQSTYTEKVLKHFHMDKSHPLSSPWSLGRLNLPKIHFGLKKKMKNCLVLKYHISVQFVL